MGHKLEGNKLTVDLNLDSQTSSKSGKTIMLASSGGFIGKDILEYLTI